METSKPKSTLVIGGTSHAGKSTLAERLCPPDGRILHTDTLGPHPGRPWPMPGKPVKPHVAAHYRELDVPELIAHVLR
ncbi:MAG: 2-phosphoglycerate kinase, partial [Planctomycetota bacterium]